MRVGEGNPLRRGKVKEGEEAEDAAGLLGVRGGGEVVSLRGGKVKDEEADVRGVAGLPSGVDGHDCDDERRVM
jgi:hypothetical protein